MGTWVFCLQNPVHHHGVSLTMKNCMHISPTNLYLEGTFLNIKPQLQNFNKYNTDDPQNNPPSYKFWTHTLKRIDYINNES